MVHSYYLTVRSKIVWVFIFNTISLLLLSALCGCSDVHAIHVRSWMYVILSDCCCLFCKNLLALLMFCNCIWCLDPFFRKRPISRSVSHAQIFEYIDDRLRVAYRYFATTPSQRADVSQKLASGVRLELCDSTITEQASVSESLSASDYEFTESALVDKKVRCHRIWCLYSHHVRNSDALKSVFCIDFFH